MCKLCEGSLNCCEKLIGEMSADRISAGKRKASDVGLDSEDVGFPPQLKIIVTAPPRRAARNQKFLEFKPADEPATAEFVLPTEHIDVGAAGLILPTENIDIGIHAKNLTDGDEECETPKSEEHRIPKVLTCPPAPRKPRPTARRKTESAARSRALFVNDSELNLFFGMPSNNFQVR